MLMVLFVRRASFKKNQSELLPKWLADAKARSSLQKMTRRSCASPNQKARQSLRIGGLW
jgi:hypothetical protein